MAIIVTLDRERHRAFYKVSGPVTGAEVMASRLEHQRDHPEMISYDIICDLTDYTGDVTADEMLKVAIEANRLAPPGQPKARTAFVTLDPYFHNWARVLSHQFTGRQFQVFRTAEAAEAWLAPPPATGEPQPG